MELTYRTTNKYNKIKLLTFSPNIVYLMTNPKYKYKYFSKFNYNFRKEIISVDIIMTDLEDNILNVETITNPKVIRSYFELSTKNQTLTAFDNKIEFVEPDSVGIDFGI